MSDHEIDIDETCDPIVSVPRSRRRSIKSSLRFGLDVLIFAALGAYLLSRDPAIFNRRFLVAVVAGFSFLVALVGLILVRTAWKPATRHPIRLILVSLIFSATSALLLYKLLLHRSAVFDPRFLTTVVAGFCFLVAFLFMIILRLVLRPPLAIRKAGIELQGGTLPWEVVDSCHWGYRAPGNLNIRTHHTSLSVSVPESYRADVEAALRRFGKWQD
jgi:hypothetical protein